MTSRCVWMAFSMAALAAAQQAAPGPGPGLGGGLRGGFGPGGFAGPMSERRLTRELNLNAAQQNTVHTALEEARVMLQGTAEQERDLRTQLATAVKSGDEASIDRISQGLANLQQQRIAVQAKAMAKISGSLNADQKTQIDRQLGRALGAQGPRPRAGRAPQAPPAPPQQ